MIDTASEHTYRAIRQDIIHGKLVPRVRLRLDSLRETYGASVSTLREILNRLTGEGLVAAEGQKGFSVTPVSQHEFENLAELRELFEAHAIRRAFQNGDLEWEGRVVGAHHMLGVIEQRMQNGAAQDATLWKHHDKQFHHALISACGSQELLSAHSAVFDRYLRYQIIAVIFRGAAASKEHLALRDAALARDADLACRVLHQHIAACVAHTAEVGTLESGGPDTTDDQLATEETVAGSIWRNVRRDILNGTLAPMQKLKLDGLRDRYNASVSTLREVLSRLATEGLVLAEGQRGFEVAPISPANLRELAELRLLIEGQALRDSFARGDVEWEAHVMAAYHRLVRMEERMRQGDSSVVPDWKRFDWEFHQALISACGSRVLRQFHGANFDKYLRYQMIALSFRGDVASNEHRALLDAAMSRDADAARAILKRHLLGGVDHALSSGTIGEGCVSTVAAQVKPAADGE
jgi:DNA-binding GntR family transcriptional regulator